MIEKRDYEFWVAECEECGEPFSYDPEVLEQSLCLTKKELVEQMEECDWVVNSRKGVAICPSCEQEVNKKELK